MKVVQVILLVILIGVCLWLVIDTVLYIVKKVKMKKLKAKQKALETKEETTVEPIDTTEL